jgi:Fe-S cluster assembly iron-binding protein IscA
MFQVTEAAVDRMAEMRAERNMEPDQGMVLVVGEDSQLAVAIGTAQENDQVYERNGEPIVIVPAQLGPTLDGLVLDHTADGFIVTRVEDM